MKDDVLEKKKQQKQAKNRRVTPMKLEQTRKTHCGVPGEGATTSCLSLETHGQKRLRNSDISISLKEKMLKGTPGRSGRVRQRKTL